MLENSSFGADELYWSPSRGLSKRAEMQKAEEQGQCARLQNFHLHL